MKAIVVDDEDLVRGHLCRMLRDLGVEVIGEGESGPEVLPLVTNLRPDVLFLDIQLPEITGMDAAATLSELKDPPLLVFVTGYSEHAVSAFERRAVDYLLKPVTPERLAKAVSRVQDFRSSRASSVTESSSPTKPLQRLAVRTDYSIKLLRVEDIECVTSRDKKVFIRQSGKEQRAYYSLVQLEEMLPKDQFMRIHSSAIVRLSLIESLNFLGNHTYSVSLRDGLVLPVGRTYYAELQEILGLD